MKPQILIVDDSLTVRMDLEDAFTEAGFSPALCTDLQGARRALERARFVLVVLDVLLPDGDGLDLLRELRADSATAGVPVLLLSSEAEVRDRVRGLASGADDYVGKPYDRVRLISRARELISKSHVPARPLDSRLVLVIDDSLSVCEELRTALELRGYGVHTADTGEEGLRLAAQTRPDAIVVDGHLPGIDGTTVVQRIRSDAALRATPCLLLTGSDERSAEIQSFEAGADSFTRKAEGTDVILARLEALLRSAIDGPSRSTEASLYGTKKVLAVDDSVTYLQSLTDALNAERYDVIAAHSGEEALQFLAAQPVDCILLDLVMPGMSGDETCRRIKRAPEWRGIPVVMLTAREDRDAMIGCFTAGADDFVCKSSEFELLGARLRAQLRRKQYEDENRRMREEVLRKESEATEARALRELAETRARLLKDLERANSELEAFSYSVSHDLRAPLRAIDGFTAMMLCDFSQQLPAEAQHLLECVRDNARQMKQLIDDLLEFSRLGRQTLRMQQIDLTDLVRHIVSDLQPEQAGRHVKITISDLGHCQADPNLLKQVLINLVSNALKFTRKRTEAVIEIGAQPPEKGQSGPVYFVKDNGAGFDMQYSRKLFGVFQRLHSSEEFEGTGVGLALVHRIIGRHGGRVWAEAQVNQGATFYFTLPEPEAAAG